MRKKVFILIIVFILIFIGILIIKNLNKNDNKILENNFVTIDKNQVSYKEDITVNELKEDYGLNGDSNIYEIQTEYDGRKVLSVKANLKFKVAFNGIIKRELPKYEELDGVIQNNYPKKNGIWIEKNSREKIVDLLNNNEKIKSVYKIDGEGYLIIDEKNNQTELDKKIEKSINSENQDIIAISSICYIVDDVTGEILDYNFENMDKYQTYECFNDCNKKIIFITENKNKMISNDDILGDIINLL